MLKLRLVATLVCLVTSVPSFAQTDRATVGGRVRDAQGAVIAKADVAVISDDTGVVQQVQTNQQGNWSVQFLLPGKYHFTVTAPGFKREDRTGITLQIADNKTIDVQLEVGSATQSVEVQAEAPLIDTTAAVSGTVISQKEITEMPSMSRVTTLLATLSPGVIAQDQNNNVVHLWSNNGASQFLVDGGRDLRSNNYQIDGMPNVKAGGNVSFIAPPDSISEFRIQSNAYDASIGRQAGATINMMTKAGTKDYHGSLYEFNQNNVLNANLFQTNLVGGDKPPVHFNEYGGTIGGPVWLPKIYDGRQKTFFFLNFDGTRNQDPRFGTRSVPTQLERNGDFSQSFTTQVVNGQRVRYPIQTFDPLTVDAKGNRTMFPGNIVPAGRLNPISQNILKFVPLPNAPGDGTSTDSNNFIPSSTRQNKMALITSRADHQWNNNNRSFITLRWSHEDEFTGDDFRSVATGNFDTRVAEGAGVDHVWALSANKVLDLRVGVSRYSEPTHDHGAGFDPTSLGFPASLGSQLQVQSFPFIKGFAGDFGTGQAAGNTTATFYTFNLGLTHVKGNHTMRSGFEYWINQQANLNVGKQLELDFDNSNWTRQNATVGGGTGVGSSFASFILGLPNGGNVPYNANGSYSQRFACLYFQDDWRVTSRLTLNLGLRWDAERPVTERYNRITSNFDPNAINPTNDAVRANYAAIGAANASNANVQTLLGIVPPGSFNIRGNQLFAGVNGQSSQVTNTDWREFQPRFGVAYQITPTTVIRGGFGRFVQASFETAGQNGFSRTTNLTATQDNFFTPFDTLSNPFSGGVLAPTGSSLGALTNLGQGVNFLNQDANRAYSWEYSVHLQQQVKSWLFELGYSHNKTYGIYQDRNINLPSTQLWQQLRTPRFDAAGRPLDKLLWDELVPNPFYKANSFNGGISTSQQTSISQLIRPLAYLGDQKRNDNPLGRNTYDAMLFKAERRFSSGFSIITSFTWSKLFEDTSLIGPENAGVRVEHKLGGEDRPLHLSVAPIYELPFGHGKKFLDEMPKALDFILGGWELSGQYTVQSGVPVVFNATDSFFFDGQEFALSKDKQSLSQWFDTSHFIRFPDKNTSVANYPAWTGVQNLPGYNYVPAPGDTIKNGVYQDFGTYVRNIPTRWAHVRASNVNEVTAGIYKNFRFFERYRLQYRFEAFNALNHPRFGAPNADPTSAQFGQVQPSQVNNARLIQMALKLYF